MPEKRTTVKFDVFGYTYTIIRTDDVLGVAKKLRGDIPGAAAQFIEVDEKPMHGYLVFGLEPTPGIIAHESFHAVWNMLKGVGAELDDETVAYHLDYLVSAIHKFMNRTSGR